MTVNCRVCKPRDDCFALLRKRRFTMTFFAWLIFQAVFIKNKTKPNVEIWKPCSRFGHFVLCLMLASVSWEPGSYKDAMDGRKTQTELL